MATPFTETDYKKIKKKIRKYLLKEYYESYPVHLFNAIGSEGDHNTRQCVYRAITELLNHKPETDRINNKQIQDQRLLKEFLIFIKKVRKILIEG